MESKHVLELTLDDTLKVCVAVRVKERVECRVEIGQPERDGVDYFRHSRRVDGANVKDEVKRHPADEIREDEIGEWIEGFLFMVITILVPLQSLPMIGSRRSHCRQI